MTYRQSGFTLIELMIAMLIGTVIAAGSIQLFMHSMQVTNRSNEIQRSQQTLLATAEHILPRIRQARSIGPDSDDITNKGVELDRQASAMSPGHDCTGAPLNQGEQITERYFVDGEDLYCESRDESAVVAFEIEDFYLNRVYQDTSNDGKSDIIHTDSFPGGGIIVGVELVIEQSTEDGSTRTVPIHVALRNNALQGRNKSGDFAP